METHRQPTLAWKRRSWKIHILTLPTLCPAVSCLCLRFAEPNPNPEGRRAWSYRLHGSVPQGTERMERLGSGSGGGVGVYGGRGEQGGEQIEET